MRPSLPPSNGAESPPRIAIDIGGVLAKYQPGCSDEDNPWHLTRESEMPRAMLSLREIVKRFGATNTFIISRAGSRMAKRSKHGLLTVMAIEEVTGFDPNNIYFCAKTVGSRGKGRIAKRLGITHMIDD